MTKKVGRNDPCPCGSGKKYKSCCMLKADDKAAAKYTAAGKRKFKAKVLSLQDKSLSIFGRSAPQPQVAQEANLREKLKFRMTKDSFLTTTPLAELSFPTASEEKPVERELHLPKPDEEFKPTTEDFRKKKE